MIKKILVTGSSGTIGTRLCEVLLTKGYDVYGVDVRQNKWNKNLVSITTLADLRSTEAIEKIPKDVDMVIHLAANARVYDLVVEPDLAFDNVKTVYNVLEFCRKNNVKRILFSSSREVYGNSDKINCKESDARIENCESPYSASKIAGRGFREIVS